MAQAQTTSRPRGAAKGGAAKGGNTASVRPQQQQAALFLNVGAIFEGREAGDFNIPLGEEFARLLGLDALYNIEAGITLCIRERLSKKGESYRSIFVAGESLSAAAAEEGDEVPF